jgi:hypothetical protein
MAQPPQGDPLVVLQAELAALCQQVQDQQNLIDQNQQQITAIPVAPGAPIQNPHRVKYEKPHTYHGKTTENLESWIFKMDEYCELTHIQADEQVRFAATYLKDQANLWWRSYKTSINWATNAPTWEQFTDVLKRQFVPVNTTISAYDRLQRLSQKTSVNQYNHEFRALMMELPQMDQTTRLDYYIKGLKSNIRPFVTMFQPTNLMEAETTAERVDAATYIPGHRTPGPSYTHKPRPTYRAPGGPAPMELDAITKLTPAERDRLRHEGGCFRCRKKGHLARECTMTNRKYPEVNAMDEDPEESGKE